MIILYAIIGGSLLTLAYLFAGGRSILKRIELPSRIIGHRLTLQYVDGLGANPPPLPDVEITAFANGEYQGTFVVPYSVDGRTMRDVRLWARHKGYPLSGAKKRGVLAACIECDTGDGFIAQVWRRD